MPGPEQMMSSMLARLQERTGRDLDGWLALIACDGPDPLDQNAVRRWLKDEHGLPQNAQWLLADTAARRAGWVEPSVEEYVDTQFSGAKAGLRPVYDRIAEHALALEPDVTVEGRGTYVPFVRRRQFAAVAAAARDRVDLGLRFVDAPSSSRLEPAKGLAQATHKVALASVDEVDDEVVTLLRTAYAQNG